MIYTPKGDNEHPEPFHMGFPPLPCELMAYQLLYH